MRIVLDTNILISAFFWEGRERKILLDCRKKKHQLVISPDILKEMNRILDKKFKVPIGKRNEYTLDILLIADVVLPKGSIQIVKEHPTDNIIIETAILGKADRLITGDKHLLNLESIQGIKIEQARKIK